MRTIVENKYIRRIKSSENDSTLIVEKRKKNKSIEKKNDSNQLQLSEIWQKKVFTQCIANEIIERIAILMAQIYC